MKLAACVATGLALALSVELGAQIPTTSPSCAAVTRPAPRGGSPNTPGGSLIQSVFEQGTGPYEYWGPGGAGVVATHSGPAGQLGTLILGAPATNFINFGAAGSLDIDITQAVGVLYDGLGAFGPSTATTVPQSLAYALPVGVTAYLASAQGANADPGSPVGFRVTGRNDIGVQDISAPGVPGIPPFVGFPQPVNPAWPGTTGLHPFPRDVICPNNGPTSSGIGADNGTLHSCLAINLDATAPAATTATVNGNAVDVFCTRPTELLFFLNPLHQPAIAGPIVITSTGGTYTPSADLTGAWVFARPQTVGAEAMGGGFGGSSGNVVSGSFGGVASGIQAFIGAKAAPVGASSEVDYYNATGLTANTPIVFAAMEYDAASGQVLSQCSGLPSTPAAPCYVNTAEPYSQQWFAPNALQDTYIHQGTGTAVAPILAAFLISQDDGGPGTGSYNGRMAGSIGTATQPTLDPDLPWAAQGGNADWIVADDFPNPTPGAFPYTYMLICYW